ncbi:MAG: Gfo/Idh/MocA family oxidoreductase [Deltaproteobacteria bacterium]|jgi:predicted dehydrogenase|nr:Gfo/Idh/MocA family oxidoreductase [Deltaproteobacteria bacterium]
MKALFIGLGSIGQRHLRNLKRLVSDELEVMAVRRTKSVPLLTETMAAAEDGHTPASKYAIQEFSDISNALEQRPDMVFITNPSSLHVADAKHVLEYGDIAVFIEKPLGGDWCGVEELCALVEAKKRRVLVGYQFRFHPALRKIKLLLESQTLGNIVSARLVNGEYLPDWHPYEDYRTGYAANRHLGGGALVTQIHEFDLAYWFFGRPATIYAIGGHLSSLELNVEDSVISILGYDSSRGRYPVSIQHDFLQYPPERSVTIVGDQGKASWNAQDNKLIVSNTKIKRLITYEYLGFDRNSMFLEQVTHFLDVVSGTTPPMVSVFDAAASLEMALQAKKVMNGIGIH